MAGMTDYTGVPLGAILSHLRDWREQTKLCIESLRRLNAEVENHRARIDRPDNVVAYIRFFVDLFERYVGDFERLLAELPQAVTDAHVEIVQQIYTSVTIEEKHCTRFTQDHIDRELKDEGLRWLLDDIYEESRGMLHDYYDLSNLVPRLRTFVATTPKIERELEQKFRILLSAAQERRDFEFWTGDAAGVDGYSIGIIFLDVDDFKRLNSTFTESVVDKTILPSLQRLIRDLCLHRGAAYRHGGEEIVILLPNYSLDEASRFAEKVRSSIEAHGFQADDRASIRLTISAGVAAWPLHGDSLERVIEVANSAEHVAKEDGKNRVHTATA